MWLTFSLSVTFPSIISCFLCAHYGNLTLIGSKQQHKQRTLQIEIRIYVYYMCVFAHTHKYSEQISPAGLSFPLKIIKFSIIIRGKCGNFFIFCGLLLALNSVFVRAGIGMNGVICTYIRVLY